MIIDIVEVNKMLDKEFNIYMRETGDVKILKLLDRVKQRINMV